jgi:hypothetical protein
MPLALFIDSLDAMEGADDLSRSQVGEMVQTQIQTSDAS